MSCATRACGSTASGSSGLCANTTWSAGTWAAVDAPSSPTRQPRRLVGWSINTHMRAELVIDALDAAVAARGGRVNGVIFHSDRGAQCGSGDVADACRRHGIRG
ncbi:DDE-type integrase/transposase/recombinase [Salinispora arenicola]|uniref:DDE-type integrase/transposase/recombinase n=1 Tax=Salinispora arenicola TaxID=168697 RepID=UPI0039AFF23F